MIGYASRTGTRRNLAALRDADWRLLVSARGVLRTEGFRYALDNGAWTAHQRGESFDVGAFERAVELVGDDADWIVVPDVVMDARRTLELAERWLPKLSRYRLLVAVQNGMTPRDVRPWLSERVGIFLGGDTNWKLDTMRSWGEVARESGAHFHVGRVNSAQRIHLCHLAGADSFDGTSASRFAESLPRLDHAVRQMSLFGAMLANAVLPRGVPDRARDILAACVAELRGDTASPMRLLFSTPLPTVCEVPMAAERLVRVGASTSRLRTGDST